MGSGIALALSRYGARVACNDLAQLLPVPRHRSAEVILIP